MFTNKTLISIPGLGEIRKSEMHAPSPYRFNNITKGIAIKYVYEGKEKYVVGGQFITVREGEFILLPNEAEYCVEHETSNNSNSSLTRGICVDINPSALSSSKSIGLELFNLYGVVLQSLASSQLDQSFKELNARVASTDHHEILKNLNNQLLKLMISNHQLQDNLSRSVKNNKKRKELIVKLMSAQEYVHRHYREKIKLDDIVDRVGMSKFHFNRLFRQAYSESPLELQHRLRMEVAKEKIIEDRLSLTQIAHLLGYFDLPAFNRQFKKHWQVAPSQVQE